MNIRRITANLAVSDTKAARDFYVALFGLDVLMDYGWIVTLGAENRAPAQLSLATEGGSGTAVPDLSIEVDDVDEIYSKAQTQQLDIAYPLTDEPWGVRRFYLRDPNGRVLNILSHAP